MKTTIFQYFDVYIPRSYEGKWCKLVLKNKHLVLVGEEFPEKGDNSPEKSIPSPSNEVNNIICSFLTEYPVTSFACVVVLLYSH